MASILDRLTDSLQHRRTQLFSMCLLMLIVVFASLSLVEGKISLPNLLDNVWSAHNGKVKTLVNPINFALSHDLISPSTAAQRFSKTLYDYLSSEPDFASGVRGGGGGRRSRDRVDISDEALHRAKEEKKRLQRLISGRRDVSAVLRRQFYEAIRNHNYLKRLRDKEKRKNDAASQEKALFKDFWAFAKSAVSGQVGKEVVAPTFSRDVANEWYRGRYSVPVPVNEEALRWFPSLPAPDSPFQLAPIRPREVKEVLRQKRPTSAPGEDGVLNGHLRRFDSTHRFLATLFSKTLLESHEPWKGWADSTISLIHKAGETSDPVNFRPIALTSNIGKLFHQILLNRISSFLMNKGFIDKSTQKAFLSKINGCQDHNLILR